MRSVNGTLRGYMGDFCADALEKLLNYPIGADMILSVKERDWRPAEITTARHGKFPLLVIHDRALIEKAREAQLAGWRVMLETKIPAGGGDVYVCSIERV